MKLKVPYYSQRIDVMDPEWRAHACLVVCVKMLAEFFDIKDIPVDDWIKEGTYIGAWDGKFWKHDGIVRLLRNHGIFGYTQEFKTVDVNIKNGEMTVGTRSDIFVEKGIEKIVEKLDKKIPTIVSIYKYFTEKDRHHGIIIIGYEEDIHNMLKGFYYHDPEMPEENGGRDLFVDIDTFKNGWKRLAIFID